MGHTVGHAMGQKEVTCALADGCAGAAVGLAVGLAVGQAAVEIVLPELVEPEVAAVVLQRAGGEVLVEACRGAPHSAAGHAVGHAIAR